MTKCKIKFKFFEFGLSNNTVLLLIFAKYSFDLIVIGKNKTIRNIVIKYRQLF